MPRHARIDGAVRIDQASQLPTAIDHALRMDNVIFWGTAAFAVAVLAAGLAWWIRQRGRPVPDALKPGQALPDFAAVDEQGNRVHSSELRGSPAVLLFVRGNWCPFCSSQVKNLTRHYKDITDLGARLILVTPKPLETTRRVASFFEVDFDFWLDESLNVARDLGLLLPDGVPASYKVEYGTDTMWPTALVVDRDGKIVYANLSKFIADRPDPKTLLAAIRSTL
jgi:peroxiredoxin